MAPPKTKTLEQTVRALLQACTAGRDFGDAYNALFPAGERASVAERDSAIAALLGARIQHYELAGYVCMATGALVQMGASTQVGLELVLDGLTDGAEVMLAAGPALESAALDADEAPPDGLTPAQRRCVAGFKLHVRGAMARLARDVEARKRARAHKGLDAAIRALHERVHSHHVRYLQEVLDMLDDEPLLVVDLPAGTATRLRVSGVRSGFHLATLLDGNDPFALDAAGVRTVTGKFGYFTWPALEQKDGNFVAVHPGSLLWGEMRALDLPRFEGTRVVLRTPKVFGSRSWDFAFVAPLHDELKAQLRVEEQLGAEASRPLLERMAAAVKAQPA